MADHLSLEELAENVRNLRTAVCGLAYALGHQPQIDAERLRADMIEFVLPSKDMPHTVAAKLVTLIAEAIQLGKAEADRDRKGNDGANR